VKINYELLFGKGRVAMPKPADFPKGVDKESYVTAEGFKDAGPAPDIDYIRQMSHVWTLSRWLAERSEQADIPQRERDLLAKCSADLLK